MTYSQTAEVLSVISTAYKWFEVDEPKLKLWYGMFKNLDFNVVKSAISDHIATSEKEPTIAGVLKRIAKGSLSDQLTTVEAWGMVNRAIHKYGYNNPHLALDSFPEAVRTVIKSIGWTEICASENLSVIRGQFLKMYEEYINNELEKLTLPENLKLICNTDKSLQRQEAQ